MAGFAFLRNQISDKNIRAFKAKFLFVLTLFAIIFLQGIPNAFSENKMAVLEPMIEGLEFPSNLVALKDGSNRIFVLEKEIGKILEIKNGKILPEPFLDLSDRVVVRRSTEVGLLGLAFPPGFPAKRHVYVTYTGLDDFLVLSRFQVTEDNTRAILSSEEILLTVENWIKVHQCGHIVFSPKNKYLYMCVGDSDDQGNPRNTSQKLDHIQGKILRLDVESDEKPYGIPADNPFVNTKDVRPEIWAYGLRNPWNFSIDASTGDLWIPDTGWHTWEEINFEPASSPGGKNYGWNLAEGNLCLKECVDKGITWPIYEFSHTDARCAMIGGRVYRGKKFPDWNGIYIFADLCTGSIWAVRDINKNGQIRQISNHPVNVTLITTGPDDEIMIVDGLNGNIYRFSFPEKFEEDWKDFKEFTYEMMLESQRSNTIIGRTIKEFTNSKRWKMTQPIVDFFRWARRLFQ